MHDRDGRAGEQRALLEAIDVRVVVAAREHAQARRERAQVRSDARPCRSASPASPESRARFDVRDERIERRCRRPAGRARRTARRPAAPTASRSSARTCAAVSVRGQRFEVVHRRDRAAAAARSAPSIAASIEHDAPSVAPRVGSRTPASRCRLVTPMTPCAGDRCGSRGAAAHAGEQQNCDCDEDSRMDQPHRCERRQHARHEQTDAGAEDQPEHREQHGDRHEHRRVGRGEHRRGRDAADLRQRRDAAQVQVEAERARREREQRDVNRAARRKPHRTNSGAAAMPAKLLCDASTATSNASSALASGAGPGSRASGVRATTARRASRSAPSMKSCVSIVETGSDVASRAAPRPTSSAMPSHSSTPPGSAGSAVAARVELRIRPRVGARPAIEARRERAASTNSSSTHSE